MVTCSASVSKAAEVAAASPAGRDTAADDRHLHAPRAPLARRILFFAGFIQKPSSSVVDPEDRHVVLLSPEAV
jgi:hypothetical protein